MSKTKLQKEWELRIADFRDSGQTQSKWCADNHVKLHQLKYWLKKFEKTNQISTQSPKWVPITLDEQHVYLASKKCMKWHLKLYATCQILLSM